MFLSTTKYRLQVGDFTFQIDSNVSLIDEYLHNHYQENLHSSDSDHFIDYHLSIKHSNWFRRYLKPQVEFFFNHRAPFKPIPMKQAHALLEWGMNWVIATQAHQFLIIHAASLEKEGKGVIISAPSGSGKSTLCAYLVSQGWRLLSDEHALINLKTTQMHGLARPINLKNKSIDVIKPFFGHQDFSNMALNTHKGTICLVKPPLSSIEQASKRVNPKLLVFVNYNENEPLYVEEVDKATALTEIIQNGFNFGLLSVQGFQCAKNITEACDAMYVEYNDFHECEQVLLRRLKNIS